MSRTSTFSLEEKKPELFAYITWCQVEVGVDALASLENLGFFSSPKSESLSSLPKVPEPVMMWR